MSRTLDARSISRFQKQQYLKSLSEDDFRDQVIRPLFFRLGLKDGRDLCGPTEYGKDVIFTEEDTLGLTHLVAVQTKIGNLNLARRASNNLIESITQLRTALHTSVPLTASRTKLLPTKVFLCTSGKINDAAKRHIIDEINDPRILFLDADDLIPLLDKAFPEVWFGIDAEILPYFRAIKDLVQTRTGISETAAKIDVLAGAASDEGYVALNLYRTTTKIKRAHGKVVAEPVFEEFPATGLLAKRYPALLILAEAGMGKSTILLRIAYTIAEKGVTSKTDYTVPIILRATEIFDNVSTPIQEIADRVARSLAGARKPVFTASDLSMGRVLILVDALDEVPRKKSRKRVLESIQLFRVQYPKCRVVVTARPYRDLIGPAGYDIFNVGPISWKQAEKILRAAEKGKKLPPDQSKEILRRLEQIHGLELNPLLVSVFAATSEYSRQDIPANITELFKKFTELMLGRWDEQKGLALQYQAPLKAFLLRHVAFHMHEQKLTGIPLRTFNELIKKELRLRGHETKHETIVEEILFRSGLFRVADEHVEFRHHMLQEFFAGLGVPSIDFIKRVVVDEWWKRAIVFYFGDNPGDVRDLKDVLDDVPKLPSPDLFEAATTVGLALQACYLSHVDNKIELWKTVVASLAVTDGGILKSAKEELEHPLTAFLSYYLYGRDSVALSNIISEEKELTEWAKTRDVLETREEQEARLFWYLAALIELGEADCVYKLVRNFLPTESSYPLALYLGSQLLQEVRSTTKVRKQEAAKLSHALEPRVEAPLAQLRKEFQSHLLEYRQGKIEIVEAEGTENEQDAPAARQVAERGPQQA